MKSPEVYIIGAGTYGEALYDLATTGGYTVKGYYDEDEEKHQTTIMDVKVIGKFSKLKDTEITEKNFIVAIGNNKIRNTIMKKININGGKTPTIIHPSAVVNDSAIVGNGVYIQPNSHIMSKAVISDYCIISSNVVIGHHTKIGQGCLISFLAGVGGSISIEENVLVGSGATVSTGISKVGNNSTIGAGAVVVRDVECNSIYAGIPAKKIRDI